MCVCVFVFVVSCSADKARSEFRSNTRDLVHYNHHHFPSKNSKKRFNARVKNLRFENFKTLN